MPLINISFLQRIWCGKRSWRLLLLEQFGIIACGRSKVSLSGSSTPNWVNWPRSLGIITVGSADFPSSCVINAYRRRVWKGIHRCLLFCLQISTQRVLLRRSALYRKECRHKSAHARSGSPPRRRSTVKGRRKTKKMKTSSIDLGTLAITGTQ